MEQIGNMKLYSLEEVTDELIGRKGTPERDNFDRSIEDALHAYHIGEAIRQARKEKNLTQEQLGKLMGVQRAQVSKIENGKSLSFSTISRAFRAMGVPAKLDFGTQSLALW